ncbi:MAG TPA: DbpA RNA binding domain-containing protein, partial [Gemmatimonadaceae bacterium]|nr:DbpA RNA binding domain-containing protein [Gemmatimonadaceae bacterium]
VVNYDVPSARDAYVHRIGRTGRAGREGVAITLAEPREHRQLRNIEQATKQRITVATVPSVADLRARRLELTRAQLNEVLMAGDLDGYRVVGETLANEFDPMDVVAAAVKLVHEAQGSGEEAEEEIPAIAPPMERGAGGPARRERTRRTGEGPQRTPADRGGRAERGEPARGRGRRAPAWAAARLYIGAGRSAGVRPGDVVGAIANEAGVDASAVGAIEIADRFTLVEVPEEIADHVLRALRASTIKGRRVLVRRDRERS